MLNKYNARTNNNELNFINNIILLRFYNLHICNFHVPIKCNKFSNDKYYILIFLKTCSYIS